MGLDRPNYKGGELMIEQLPFTDYYVLDMIGVWMLAGASFMVGILFYAFCSALTRRK